MNQELVKAAGGLLKAGLSVVPVGEDKRPAVVEGRPLRWQPFQKSPVPMERERLVRLFETAHGVAVVGGIVSGRPVGAEASEEWVCRAECLDFDNEGSHYEPWCAMMKAAGLGGLLKRCYVQKTRSGGYHVVYRWRHKADRMVEELHPGGQKLAHVEGVKGVVIETRGEANYFICAPTPGYEAVQGSLKELPVVSESQREEMLVIARRLGTPKEPKPMSEEEAAVAERPGDDFEMRTTWADILEPHGWTRKSMRNGVGEWVRPGKKVSGGIGATTGFGGGDFLHVFTTSTVFETRGYSKFGAYALLNHGGCCKAAAKELAKQGFGEKREAPSVLAEDLRTVLYISSGAVKVEPSYLITPYIQKGKMTLLDADGGVGKTGFVMALAAGGSNGFFSPVGELTPFRTLYYGREDETAELETIYYACGGKPGSLAMVADNFPLNSTGLARVEKDILSFQPALVVFDPLVAFLTGVLANINEALPVNAAMDALAGVFARTGAAGMNLRHTRKSQPGQLASEAGMGSVQFRNRHRSQLVMRFHPDREEYSHVVVMEHTKGSLLSPQGSPVCFERRGNEVLFRDDVVLPAGTVGVKSFRPVGRPRDKQEEARQFLLGFEPLLEGVGIKALEAAAKAEGVSRATLHRAIQELGLVCQKVGRSTTWRFSAPFDDA